VTCAVLLQMTYLRPAISPTSELSTSIPIRHPSPKVHSISTHASPGTHHTAWESSHPDPVVAKESGVSIKHTTVKGSLPRASWRRKLMLLTHPPGGYLGNCLIVPR
jgi:hypothetical protein